MILTTMLVQTLLHQDRLVRVTAASLGFGVGAWVQGGRVARINGKRREMRLWQTKRTGSGRLDS